MSKTTTTSPFSYAPLTSRDIRLLSLPTNPVRPPSGLRAAPCPAGRGRAYDAISYMEDGEERPREISPNGQPFPNMAKIQQLLRALYTTTSVRRIWIGFVCITRTTIRRKPDRWPSCGTSSRSKSSHRPARSLRRSFPHDGKDCRSPRTKPPVLSDWRIR
jgi:hypothetical protein